MRGNGLYYETKRKRWRVRIFRNKQVIHESYHRDEAEARAVHDAVLVKRSIENLQTQLNAIGGSINPLINKVESFIQSRKRKLI